MRGSGQFYLKRISAGVLASLVVISAVFIYNSSVLPGEAFLYETVPYYDYTRGETVKNLFSLSPGSSSAATDAIPAFLKDSPSNRPESSDTVPLVAGSSHTPAPVETPRLLGPGDVSFQDIQEHTEPDADFHSDTLLFDFDKLNNLDYLAGTMYTVERSQSGDKATDITPDLFSAAEFLAANLKITQKGSEPKVLIFSTHSAEMFADSDPDNPFDGVLGLGQRLKEILYEKYGIAAIHHTGRFDVVDGGVRILGAYDRMQPAIKKILEENPSIEVVIDIHRDGVKESVRLVTEIDGKPVAKIMFVNGLSRVYQNGGLTNLSYLPNSFQKANLAMSFNMQLAAMEAYPDLCRKIYLKPYRYSLHMAPKSLLVEIGAQTNTKQEAFNAIELFADVLAKVLGAS